MFLRKYLDLGLTDIVSIDYDSDEEQSGFQEENTYETVVARKGSEYVKVSVHLRKRFGPRSGNKVNVGLEEPIGKDMYCSLAAGRLVMDIPEALQDIKATDELERQKNNRAEDLQKRIAAVAPRCPRCGGAVEMKKGKYGWFWSCGDFPTCDGTARLSPSTAELQEE